MNAAFSLGDRVAADRYRDAVADAARARRRAAMPRAATATPARLPLRRWLATLTPTIGGRPRLRPATSA